MQAREGLSRLDGVEAVSEQPDVRTQSCTLRTRAGALPDLEAVRKTVEGLGIGARLRGVEAVVEGELDLAGAEPVLRLSGGGATLPLRQYTHVVLWDHGAGRPQRIREKEREALKDLLRSKATAKWVRILGPLRHEAGRSGPVLEVRRFERLRPEKAASSVE